MFLELYLQHLLWLNLLKLNIYKLKIKFFLLKAVFHHWYAFPPFLSICVKWYHVYITIDKVKRWTINIKFFNKNWEQKIVLLPLFFLKNLNYLFLPLIFDFSFLLINFEKNKLIWIRCDKHLKIIIIKKHRTY